MADLNITVDSTQVKQATQELKETAQQALEAHKAYRMLSAQNPLERHFQTIAPQINAVNRSMREQNIVFQQSAGSVNQLGVVTQQAGYQIGDFLVQVQSGTNWMVAFGQQATQLVGVLPLMGAGFMGLSMGALVALSAGLGITIPLVTAIGAAFMRTREGADQASEAMKGYQKVIQDLTSATEKLRLENEMVVRGFSDMTKTQSVLELERLQKELNDAMVEYNYLVTQASETSLADAAQVGAMSQVTRELQNQIKELEARIAAYEKQLEYEQKLETAAKRRANEVRNIYREEAAAEERRRVAVINLQAAFDGVAAAAQNAAKAAASIGTAAQGAIGIVQNLAIAMWDAAQARIAANKALDAMAIEFSPGGQAMKKYGGRGVTSDKPVVFGDGSLVASGEASIGGGGGGGNAALESLIGQLQTEREVLTAWYEESKLLLTSASDSELAIVGGKHEALLRLEQEYQEKLKGIRDVGNQTALEQAGAFFGEMAQALQGGNEKMIRIGRAFGAIEATINAWRAFSQVIADPTVPWWSKIAKATAVLAAGMNAVRAIKGGGGGSGGGGSSPGTSTVAPGGQAQQAQTVYIDSIDPEGLYSGQTLMNLFDAFYNENDKRGKVFLVGRA